MASVNKVILVGNCGRDPEMRYLPDGKAVCNVSLATTSRRKDRNSGEIIEETQWHRLTMYERLAEIAGEYVKKGAPIYVEGRIKYGTYIDKATGVEKNTTDIIVSEMQLLGSRPQEDGRGGAPRQQTQPDAPRQQHQQPTQQNAPRQQTQPGYGDHRGGQTPRQAPPPQQRHQPTPPSGFDDMDDDIPFITSSAFYDMTTSKARRMAKYDF